MFGVFSISLCILEYCYKEHVLKFRSLHDRACYKNLSISSVSSLLVIWECHVIEGKTAQFYVACYVDSSSLLYRLSWEKSLLDFFYWQGIKRNTCMFAHYIIYSFLIKVIINMRYLCTCNILYCKHVSKGKCQSNCM